MPPKPPDEALPGDSKWSCEDLSARLETLQQWLRELVAENQLLRESNREWERASQLNRPLHRAVDVGPKTYSWARPPRILVVDDEATIAFTLAQILVKHGFCATWFSDPFEALGFAQTVVPDLLLSDVMMPSLCGIELAIRMRESNPQCKIILLSANAGIEDLLRQVREQGHHFELHAKPIPPTQLISEIHALLGTKSLHVNSA